MRPSVSYPIVWLLLSTAANSFVTKPRQRTTFKAPSRVISRSAANSDEEPVECFVVNNEMVETEGEKPQVVCTSEPEEFAWFNGIERNAMRPTDGTEEEAEECVEGASPKGTPEWECK